MFAVDDDFPTSPKLESIEDWRTQALAIACWTLLGAACRKRGNGGVVTRRLLDDVLHRWPKRERERAAEALVAARGDSEEGLWVPHERGWRFHEWEVWQPTAEEAAEERKVRSKKSERQRRWRHGKKLGVDGEASTGPSTSASTGASTDPSTSDASTASTNASTQASLARRDAHACAARDPVPIPSLPVPEEAAAASDFDTIAAARCLHEVMRRSGRSTALYAEHAWRRDYETILAGIAASVPPQNRRVALIALFEWVWMAPDGPVASGRVLSGKCTPALIAKGVSNDLEAANAWFAARQEAAQ